MARALLSNGSVNKPQQRTVFYGVRTEQKHGDRKSAARQRSGDHASIKMGDGVFRGVRAKKLS
jgi:hypothetical protein